MDYFVFVFFHGGGSVHKNIFDSESIKPNVKTHRFRMTSHLYRSSFTKTLGRVNFGV